MSDRHPPPPTMARDWTPIVALAVGIVALIFSMPGTGLSYFAAGTITLSYVWPFHWPQPQNTFEIVSRFTWPLSAALAWGLARYTSTSFYESLQMCVFAVWVAANGIVPFIWKLDFRYKTAAWVSTWPLVMSMLFFRSGDEGDRSWLDVLNERFVVKEHFEMSLIVGSALGLAILTPYVGFMRNVRGDQTPVPFFKDDRDG